MPIEPVEIIKLLINVIIITIPGYFLSYLFSKTFTQLERIVFGFVCGLMFLVIGTFILDVIFKVKITQTLIIALFTIYFVLSLILYVLSLRKSGLPKINLNTLKNKKILLLVCILGFSFVMNFLPHLTNNYYLPFHVDEWIHWSSTRAVIESGSTVFIDPYTGSGIVADSEIGFHLVAGIFYWLSETDFLTIFLIMPAIFSVFISLTVFNIGERATRKFGLESAFFVTFIPTTVRFLGPSFFVPVTLGLLGITFTIWLCQHKKIQTAFFIPLSILFMFLVHPPTALTGLLIIFMYSIFLVLEKQYKIAFINIGLTLLPIVIILLFTTTTRWGYSLNEVIHQLFGAQYSLMYNLPKIWPSFEQLGILTWVLSIIGIYFCFTKGKATERTIGVSMIIFIIIIGAYDKFGYGSPIFYERSFLYLFLGVALIAGYGAAELRRLVTENKEKVISKKFTHLLKNIDRFIPIIICLVLLLTAVPAHLNIPYYKIINEKDYETFTWIHANIDDYRNANHTYDKAAVDPFIASPFTTITGVHTISSSMSPLYGYELHTEMEKFIREKCVNTSFLKKYNIGVVYGVCINNNLTMIHPNVYLYPELYKE